MFIQITKYEIKDKFRGIFIIRFIYLCRFIEPHRQADSICLR